MTRPNGDGCERCWRLKKQCQPSEAIRKRSTQNHEADEQVAKLEGKIETLTSMLQSVINASEASVDPTSRTNEPSSAANMHWTVNSSIIAFNDIGTGPALLSPFPIEGSSQPMPTPPDEPAPHEADGFLNLFRDRMLPCFPFIDLSPSTTAWDLCKDRPLLFQAIVAVATPSTHLKVARIERLKHLWAKSALLENQSTFDILLSILTYITWSTDPFLKRSSSLSRMMMLAVSILYDLQRAKQPPPEAHAIATIAPGLGETNWDADEASIAGLLELRRATLACFVLSSIISSYFRRTDPVRWTPQMEEGLHIISTNNNCPSDEAFALQVRLQLLAQKIAQIRENHEADTISILSTSATPTSLYLGVLQKQLQELKASLSPNLSQINMLTAYAHYVDLCLNDVIGLATSNASNVSGGVSMLLSRGSTNSTEYHQPLILKHLSTFQDPAWNCQAVHDAVDTIKVLDWMAEKAELASKEAGEKSDDDLFYQISRMLRRSQAWVNAKRRAAGQVVETPASGQSDGPGFAAADNNMFDPNQVAWMNAFEAGDTAWFEDFLGWSPGTL